MLGLEFPGSDGRVDPDELYLARGPEETSPYRPYLIGDVFDGVAIPTGAGGEKKRRVAILQHPCSMRKDGVNLKDSILVAKVSRRRPLTADQWGGGYFGIMPLPELEDSDNPKHRDHAIDFGDLYTVSPGQLEAADRMASLSPIGINLLLQRWVHYMSRVVVPTFTFDEATSPFYEEADLIEEWCEQTAADGTQDAIRAAGIECMEQLRADRPGGRTYQKMHQDPQARSTVRKALRKELRERARHTGTAELQP